jgi:hypothetical protein
MTRYLRERLSQRQGDELVTVDEAVVFNPLQQHHEGFDLARAETPIEEGDEGTTDPWGITE